MNEKERTLWRVVALSISFTLGSIAAAIFG